MYKFVAPCQAETLPEIAAVSRTRADVVPTAMTRPPACLAELIAAEASSDIDPNSLCIRCSSIQSTSIGLNVPTPTCRVTRESLIPSVRSCSISDGVKCKPAVGAAMDPCWVAYGV